MDIDPQIPSYKAKQPRIITFVVSVFAILGFCFTLWVVWDAWKTKEILWLYAAIGFWAVIPPFWFWAEYFFIYKKWGEKGTLELFKYGQQIAGTIWAGVLVILIAFASSDIFKGV